MSNTNLANVVAIAANDAIVDSLDDAATAGYVRIYDDGAAQPSGVDDAVPAGSNQLAEFILSDPAFGDSVDATPGAEATANSISDTTADTNGIATWFRAFDGDGNAKWDGDVSESGNGGDMIINSTDISSGSTVSMLSWVFGHNE